MPRVSEETVKRIRKILNKYCEEILEQKRQQCVEDKDQWAGKVLSGILEKRRSDYLLIKIKELRELLKELI